MQQCQGVKQEKSNRAKEFIVYHLFISAPI